MSSPPKSALSLIENSEVLRQANTLRERTLPFPGLQHQAMELGYEWE